MPAPKVRLRADTNERNNEQSISLNLDMSNNIKFKLNLDFLDKRK